MKFSIHRNFGKKCYICGRDQEQIQSTLKLDAIKNEIIAQIESRITNLKLNYSNKLKSEIELLQNILPFLEKCPQDIKVKELIQNEDLGNKLVPGFKNVLKYFPKYKIEDEVIKDYQARRMHFNIADYLNLDHSDYYSLNQYSAVKTDVTIECVEVEITKHLLSLRSDYSNEAIFSQIPEIKQAQRNLKRIKSGKENSLNFSHYFKTIAYNEKLYEKINEGERDYYEEENEYDGDEIDFTIVLALCELCIRLFDDASNNSWERRSYEEFD